MELREELQENAIILQDFETARVSKMIHVHLKTK